MGCLIAIEGIDASGKRTHTQVLLERLRAAGVAATALSFPRYGETFFAAEVERYLNGDYGALKDLDPRLVSLLFAGDRFESRDLITKAMSDHEVVLLDRYVASNLAHQGARMEAEYRQEFVDWLSRLEHCVYGLPKPDLTVLLDVSPVTSGILLGRKPARSYTNLSADIHERDSEYLSRCRDMYLWLARNQAGSEWTVVPVETDGVLRDVASVGEDLWLVTRAALSV